MSLLDEKTKAEVERALKEGKLVVIVGKSESKVSIKASDPSKLKVIVRE